MDLRIADVRTTEPEYGQEMSIHGRTKVGNLEDYFLGLFGIYMQVCFSSPDGSENYYTNEEQDEMTLSELNREIEEIYDDFS